MTAQGRLDQSRRQDRNPTGTAVVRARSRSSDGDKALGEIAESKRPSRQARTPQPGVRSLSPCPSHSRHQPVCARKARSGPNGRLCHHPWSHMHLITAQFDQLFQRGSINCRLPAALSSPRAELLCYTTVVPGARLKAGLAPALNFDKPSKNRSERHA